MGEADGIVTVRCGARRWRLEGFEDAFAALGALAPWLGEAARGEEAEAPPWAGMRMDGNEVVLRPAAGAEQPREPGVEEADRRLDRDDGQVGALSMGADAEAAGSSDAARGTADDASAAVAPSPTDASGEADFSPADPATARGEPPCAGPTDADPWEEMLARLARPALDEDPSEEGGTDASAEGPDAAPDGTHPPRADAGEPLGPAEEAAGAPAADEGAAASCERGDASSPEGEPVRRGLGEEMDRIVFRLSEATGARPVAPEEGGHRPLPRRPHRTDPPEVSGVEADPSGPRGRAGPDRPRREPEEAVIPRRPARRAGAGPAPRVPGGGKEPCGARSLPPLMLTDAHRVGARPAPPTDPVVPRRVVARGR